MPLFTELGTDGFSVPSSNERVAHVAERGRHHFGQATFASLRHRSAHNGGRNVWVWQRPARTAPQGWSGVTRCWLAWACTWTTLRDQAVRSCC